MRTSNQFACLGLGAALVFLTGCGGTSTASPQPSAPGAATGTPVKIGFMNALGGALSYPDKEAATKAAVRAINAHGGLNNHPIVLDECNDKGDAQAAGQCARQMVTDQVVAVVGGIAIQDQVVVPVLKAAGIPVIGGGGRSSATLTTDNMYNLDSGTAFVYPSLTAYGIKKLGLTVGEVSNDSPAATGLRASIDTQLKGAGIKFSSLTLVSPTAADFGPIVQSAKQNGTNAVTTLLPPSQLTLFIKASADAGANFKQYFVPSFVDPGAASQIGGASELDKVIVGSPYPLPYTPGSSNPVIKKFQADLAAAQAAGDADAALNKQSLSFSSWLAFYAFQQIIAKQNVKELTSASIITAMNATQNLDLGGVIPDWTPNKKGPPGLDRVSNSSYWFSGYKGGQPFLVTTHAVEVQDALNGNF